MKNCRSWWMHICAL